MMENPRVEESPQRLPGICKGCGASGLSGRAWFIDTDCDEMDTPSWAVIFCDLCFDWLSKVAGYQKFEMIQNMNKDRIAELEKQVDELTRIRDLCLNLGIDIERALAYGVDNREAGEGSTGAIDIPSEPVERRKKRTPVTIDDEGMAELRPSLSLSETSI